MVSVCCTVTNDLTYDQRMNRICNSLAEAGYDVTLVGRKRGFSQPLLPKRFQQKRLRCWFNKGKLFYLEYNLRLLFYLLFQRYDVLCAIDLDSIIPNKLVASWKGKPLVYDAHEYFTEMEEVVARPMVHKAWQRIERWSLPGIKYGYTVSEGYARMFRDRYGLELEIVRNATVLRELPLGKPGPYILYQGAVNVGRGLQELVEAMKQVDCPLYICGKGDLYDALQEQVQASGLEDKVKFWGYVEPDELRAFTAGATVGITLFSNAGLSNQYSLANRFFDYFHAAVPQLAMNYPEYHTFFERFPIGTLLDELTSDAIAEALNHLLTDQKHYKQLVENCKEARQHYNWQEEEKRLVGVYRQICKDRGWATPSGTQK